MVDFRTKFWNTGLIIAFFCVFENCLKVSLSTAELVLGHFRDAMPNETRVYIHSIFLVFFGALGIVCSILLFIGLSKKTSGCILSWIAFQQISIVHSVFFTFELLAIRHSSELITVCVCLFMISYILLQVYLALLIYRIYHSIVETELVPTIAAPWRVPTISELLGDQAVMGESEPPAYHTLCIGINRGSSEA